MDDQQINVTLMTDSTDFLLLDNHDININSFYGDLKQLKNETRKQADKEKEEVLEDSKTEKTKPNQLLEELKRLVKADITEIVQHFHPQSSAFVTKEVKNCYQAYSIHLNKTNRKLLPGLSITAIQNKTKKMQQAAHAHIFSTTAGQKQ